MNRLSSLLLLWFTAAPVLMQGCSYLGGGFHANSAFAEANRYFDLGSYGASLDKYRQIAEKDPSAADRALFEMGIVHAHPKNEQKDYRKAEQCFEKVIKDYPNSPYRQDSQMMVFYLTHFAAKDEVIASQRAQIEALQQEMHEKEDELATLREKMKEIGEEVSAPAVQAPADSIVIEKRARRLTLLSKGKVLKSYNIALGGNPIGRKERQGDNRTPEGIYRIDWRKRDSQYHLALHISYPNDEDKKRAKELGVSPGGDIEIHGIKNGFSWVGDLHTRINWTKGCIAVTDGEIEEIDKMVPDGTMVEIRP